MGGGGITPGKDWTQNLMFTQILNSGVTGIVPTKHIIRAGTWSNEDKITLQSNIET
jgi:hypothetical protein